MSDVDRPFTGGVPSDEPVFTTSSEPDVAAPADVAPAGHTSDVATRDVATRDVATDEAKSAPRSTTRSPDAVRFGGR